MEYPKVAERIQNRILAAKERLKKLEEMITEQRRILQLHLATKDNKKPLYEKHDELTKVGDTESASDLWKKNKLGESEKRVETKEQKIQALIAEREKIAGVIRCLETDAENIQDFNPLQDQAQRPVTADEFFFAKRKEHWDIPNSIWKTFNDIFTPYQYRLMPEKDGEFGETKYDDLDLNPCIVDPERISDFFLREFDMPMAEEDASEFQKLKFKDGLIPMIKAFFQRNLKPMGMPRECKNFRLLVVSDYNQKHDGKIVHPRYATEEEEPMRRKVMQIFRNAYSTRRMTDHEDKKFKEETHKLIEMEINVRDLHATLLEIRGKKDAVSIKTKEEIMKESVDLMDSFQNSFTFHKKCARDHFATASKLRDRLNRENIPASLARFLEILSHVIKRNAEVFGNSKASKEDERTLDQEIHRSEHIISKAGDRLKEVFSDPKPHLVRSLRPDQLKLVRVKPFINYAALLYDIINKIKTGAQEAHIDAYKGVAISQLFDIERELQNILCETTKLSLEPSFKSMIGFLRNFYAFIQKHEIDDFGPIFDKLKIAIEEIANQLKQKHSEKLEPLKLYYLFKNGLKRIDFEKLLEEIKDYKF